MTSDPLDEGFVVSLEEADLVAPRYAILLSETKCWKCNQSTRVAALWVPSYTEIDHEQGEHETSSDAAVLQYVGALSAEVWQQWKTAAPWVRHAHTEGSGGSYLANHCVACDTVQGDWFVFGVDGPFFPQTAAEIEQIQFIRGIGEFYGCASPAVSSWMSKVEREIY